MFYRRGVLLFYRCNKTAFVPYCNTKTLYLCPAVSERSATKTPPFLCDVAALKVTQPGDSWANRGRPGLYITHRKKGSVASKPNWFTHSLTHSPLLVALYTLCVRVHIIWEAFLKSLSLLAATGYYRTTREGSDKATLFRHRQHVRPGCGHQVGGETGK